METILGEIITFYSYKGGVGRSMALANVACLLAEKTKVGGGVLMIDWDLEAPGLHQFFHGRFNNTRGEQGDLPPEQLGLIDLFYEIRNRLEKSESKDNIPEDIFSEIDIQKYIVKVNQQPLFLMPAGKFDDGLYSARVNKFDWVDFFSNFPSVITQFAQHLRKKYRYALIDSRTGYTDISGICTSIMPEKLVAVFTPNRQSLSGIVEMIRRATGYRMQSDDLRPLIIFPLPSRIENAENDLQKDWRFGNSNQGIGGYQEQLESVLIDVYSLQRCDLTKYFDEYQLQYKPKYSFGEEISVLSERSGDRLSLARSFKNFTEKIIGSEAPWEETKTESEKSEVDVDEISRIKSKSRRRLTRQLIIAMFVVIAIVLMNIIFLNLVKPLFTQSQSLFGLLYNLINSQYFGMLLITWIAVDVIWIRRWQSLLARIVKLITKPLVFEMDKEPDDLPLYPRRFLEQLAQSSRRNNESENQGALTDFINAQRERAFDAKQPLRSFGNVIAFIGFSFFLLADLIIVANTMLLMALVSPPLPDILQRIDYAILGGSFLSAIVGVWMIIEMSGKGELINTDQLNSPQRSIYKTISSIVILIAVLVMLALAYERLIALGYLESNQTTDLILSFTLYGLLAVNISLVAALTLSPATSGIVVILFLLISTFPVLVFFLDIVWRFVYVVVDVTSWFLTTPFIALPYGINRILRLVDDQPYQ